MEEKSILPLISRKMAEDAVPIVDCSGRKYEEGEREDIIRYVLEGAEIQRDSDERFLINKLINWFKKYIWKWGDLFNMEVFKGLSSGKK